MKVVKICLFLLMAMPAFIAKAGDSTGIEKMRIRDFIEDVSNGQVAFDSIIREYLCVESEGRDESVKWIRLALSDFR